MRLSVQSESRSFMVLDALTTTVTRAVSVLQGRQTYWAVLQTEQEFFVFRSRELRTMLEKGRQSDDLFKALRLDREKPSFIAKSRNSIVTMEAKPTEGTPQSRAVLVRKRINEGYRVYAVGTLKLKKLQRPATVSLSGGMIERRKNRSKLRGTKYRIPAPGRARIPLKKAAAKKAVGRAVIRRKRAAERDHSAEAVKIKLVKPAAMKPYDTVDIFYATDREQKFASLPSGSIEFTNRLSSPAKLRYGICSVTIPVTHKLGKIETPSIWRFEIHDDPTKHFTISAYSPRTESVFFAELHKRIDRSEGQTCFVFIHGYNVSFKEAAMRAAQLAKDLKFPGVPILYSWASANQVNLYSKDEETVDLTVRRLAPFLQRIAKLSGAKEIHLIGHSMGNRALIKALERFTLIDESSAKPFKQIVLTAPDVPRADVESLIKAAVDSAERVTLYASSKDKALGISKAKHKYERLGKVYGFPYIFVGMDSIDASSVRTDFLAHSAFAKTRSILGDLQALFFHGDPPDSRFGLKRLKTHLGICWAFI